MEIKIHQLIIRCKIKGVLFLLASTMGMAQNGTVKYQKSEIFEDQYKKSTIVLAEKGVDNDLLLVRSFNGSFISSNYVSWYSVLLQLHEQINNEKIK